MTTPTGHIVPNPDKPRVPYIPNVPGDADQILTLDTNAQPAWADINGTVYPTGGNADDLLTSDGAGGATWEDPTEVGLPAGGIEGAVLSRDDAGAAAWSEFYPYVVEVLSDGSGTPPFTATFDTLALIYDVVIDFDTPTAAAWTLDLIGNGELYTYVQALAPPPQPAASTVVAAGAASIAMPALTIALPTRMLVEIKLRQTLFTIWSYSVVATAWNAAGDTEGIWVNGTATHTFASASRIVIGGPMAATHVTAMVMGIPTSI